MSNPKRIENLDEATTLQDNDLVFASVQNSGNTYVSKKVTLANIANYVSNYIEPVPSGSGGQYEFYDTSEMGDGIYDATTIQSYFDDNSKLLLRGLKIAQTTDGVSSFIKTVSKDCVVTLEMKDNFDVKIDGIKIIPSYFKFEPNSYSRFYLKARQTLTIDSVPSDYCYVSIFPLVSGCGPFFIDTSDQTKVTTEGNVSKDNNIVTYTAPNYPVLVLFNAELTYSVIKSPSDTSGMRYYINNAQCSPTRATGFLLRANDTLRIENTDSALTKYCQYPLLVG